MTGSSRKVVLAKRREGMPDASNFRVKEERLAPLGDGMVRVAGKLLLAP